MQYPEDRKTEDEPEREQKPRLLLDGTANLEYSEDDKIPRVRGLIELLNQYFGKKQNESPAIAIRSVFCRNTGSAIRSIP